MNESVLKCEIEIEESAYYSNDNYIASNAFHFPNAMMCNCNIINVIKPFEPVRWDFLNK